MEVLFLLAILKQSIQNSSELERIDSRPPDNVGRLASSRSFLKIALDNMELSIVLSAMINDR